jgi:hypothetical protein
MDWAECTPPNFLWSRKTSAAMRAAARSSIETFLRASEVVEAFQSAFWAPSRALSSLTAVFKEYLEALDFPDSKAKKSRLTVSHCRALVRVAGALGLVSLVFVLVGLVPLLGDFLLPVGILLHLGNTLLYYRQRLTHLQVFHIFLIIQLISELQQVVNIFLLCIHLLLLCHRPGRFGSAFFACLF